MTGPMLGVDMGSVRIGIAVCEREDLPSVPLATIAHVSRAKDVSAIAAIARERGARTIVVGYPVRLDGSRGLAASSADKFLAALRAAFDGEVVAVDERMTTGAAQAKLRAAGLKPSARRRQVDRMAAVEILETHRATCKRTP